MLGFPVLDSSRHSLQEPDSMRHRGWFLVPLRQSIEVQEL